MATKIEIHIGYFSFYLYYDYDEIVGEAEFFIMLCLKARTMKFSVIHRNDVVNSEFGRILLYLSGNSSAISPTL